MKCWSKRGPHGGQWVCGKCYEREKAKLEPLLEKGKEHRLIIKNLTEANKRLAKKATLLLRRDYRG